MNPEQFHSRLKGCVCRKGYNQNELMKASELQARYKIKNIGFAQKNGKWYLCGTYVCPAHGLINPGQ